MGSSPRSSMTVAMRRTRRRLYGKAQRKSSSRVFNQRKTTPPTKVADKLMALNNLINPLQTTGELKTDQLFQETANYIVLLKTQVSILQKLVDFYGPRGHEQVQEHQNVAV